jgi:hydrogenase-1 operon protein HyaF
MSLVNAMPARAEFETGNVRPLLHEIRHALDRLLAEGQPTAIDLRSLPLAPGEEQKIEEALGEGELVAELDALGSSTLRETAFPGVWLVTHKNTDGEVIGRLIEITLMPELLKSQTEDVRAGLDDLSARLADDTEDNS